MTRYENPSKLNLVTAELFENARFSDLKSVRSPVDQYLAQSTDQTNVSTLRTVPFFDLVTAMRYCLTA